MIRTYIKDLRCKRKINILSGKMVVDSSASKNTKDRVLGDLKEGERRKGPWVWCARQEKNSTPWGRGRAFHPCCRFSRGSGSCAEYACSLHTHTRLETKAHLSSEEGVKAIQARWRQGLEETTPGNPSASSGWPGQGDGDSPKGTETGKARDLPPGAPWAVDGLHTMLDIQVVEEEQ